MDFTTSNGRTPKVGRAGTGRPAEVPERRLPLLLRRAWFSLNQAFRRRIVHLELTPDQYTVLRTLAEAATGGLTQRELTRQMSSDPNTVASLLERMEMGGLIHRQPDPVDRRARRVRLAPRGVERFALARQLAVDLQAEVLEPLGVRARGAFLVQLEQVANACRAAAESMSRRTAGRAGRTQSGGASPI